MTAAQIALAWLLAQRPWIVPTVDPTGALFVLNVPPELRRDHDPITNRFKRFPDEFLVLERAIHPD